MSLSASQQELLQRLTEICELSPQIRFGQLLSHLEFLIEDQTGQSLSDISDPEFLAVVRWHESELSQRASPVA